jgi:predicted transcriptional regulator
METVESSDLPVDAGKTVKMDPRATIQEDKVTCLECGLEFRQLTANHLQTHQLTPREYKKKWGFPLKQPLAARVLTRLRSRSAKKRGLPQKLKQYLAERQQKKIALESSAS